MNVLSTHRKYSINANFLPFEVGFQAALDVYNRYHLLKSTDKVLKTNTKIYIFWAHYCLRIGQSVK